MSDSGRHGFFRRRSRGLQLLASMSQSLAVQNAPECAEEAARFERCVKPLLGVVSVSAPRRDKPLRDRDVQFRSVQHGAIAIAGGPFEQRRAALHDDPFVDPLAIDADGDRRAEIDHVR